MLEVEDGFFSLKLVARKNKVICVYYYMEADLQLQPTIFFRVYNPVFSYKSSGREIYLLMLRTDYVAKFILISMGKRPLLSRIIGVMYTHYGLVKYKFSIDTFY